MTNKERHELGDVIHANFIRSVGALPDARATRPRTSHAHLKSPSRLAGYTRYRGPLALRAMIKRPASKKQGRSYALDDEGSRKRLKDPPAALYTTAAYLLRDHKTNGLAPVLHVAEGVPLTITQNVSVSLRVVNGMGVVVSDVLVRDSIAEALSMSSPHAQVGGIEQAAPIVSPEDVIIVARISTPGVQRPPDLVSGLDAGVSRDEVVLAAAPGIGDSVRLEFRYVATGAKVFVPATVKQIPAVQALAVTGHKVQGMSLDHIIVGSHSGTNLSWKYVACSRVRTLNGLVLLSPLPDEFRQYAPPAELCRFTSNCHAIETTLVASLADAGLLPDGYPAPARPLLAGGLKRTQFHFFYALLLASYYYPVPAVPRLPSADDTDKFATTPTSSRACGRASSPRCGTTFAPATSRTTACRAKTAPPTARRTMLSCTPSCRRRCCQQRCGLPCTAKWRSGAAVPRRASAPWTRHSFSALKSCTRVTSTLMRSRPGISRGRPASRRCATSPRTSGANSPHSASPLLYRRQDCTRARLTAGHRTHRVQVDRPPRPRGSARAVAAAPTTLTASGDHIIICIL